jgi:anti-anti-sigma factor
LEKGEVFDSNLLKDTLNSLIVEGKRNFAIDLSPLDYIYSDAINVILALNRRILDVSGRLSLLSPNPEVRSILERTGLHNILKIYETEADLLQSSEDIILQTTRFNLSDLKSYQQQPATPQSEFDDFKSEISTAMAPQAPAQPMQTPESYGTLDTEIPDEEFSSPKQAPRYEEPVAAAPPPPRPPAPDRNAPPRRKEPKQAPQSSYEFEAQPTHQKKQEPESAYGAHEPPPIKSGYRVSDRDLNRFGREDQDEEFEEEKSKGGLSPVLIGIIILVVAAAGIIGYFALMKKPEKQVTVQTPSNSAPAQHAMPELSQPAQVPAASTTPAPAPAPAPVEKPSAPPVQKPVAARPAPVRASPKAATKSQGSAGRMTILSKPSGATVIVDGKILGTTPYKWVDPPQGGIVITLSKPGYGDAVKTVDYTSGNKLESVTLAKEAPAPRSEPAASQPPPEPAPAVSAPPPAPEPAPEASSPPPAAPSSGGSSGESATIFISSMPPVADVYMDGKLIGKTNISKLNVSAGTHSMRFVKGTVEVTEDMTFKAGDNPSHFLILKK